MQMFYRILSNIHLQSRSWSNMQYSCGVTPAKRIVHALVLKADLRNLEGFGICVTIVMYLESLTPYINV